MVRALDFLGKCGCAYLQLSHSQSCTSACLRVTLPSPPVRTVLHTVVSMVVSNKTQLGNTGSLLFQVVFLSTSLVCFHVLFNIPEWLVGTWSWRWGGSCTQLKPPRERYGQGEQSSKGPEQVSSYPSQKGSGAVLREELFIATAVSCALCSLICCSHAFPRAVEKPRKALEDNHGWGGGCTTKCRNINKQQQTSNVINEQQQSAPPCFCCGKHLKRKTGSQENFPK